MSALASSAPILSAILIALALLTALPALISFIRSRQTAEEISRRLERQPTDRASPVKTGSGSFGKAISDFAESSAPANEAQLSQARAKLMAAGFTSPSAVGRYFFARLVCVLAPQVVLLFMLRHLEGQPIYVIVAISIGLVLAGLAAPGKYLDHLTNKRRAACSAGFPDMMDLLVACVEAGLSLDAAIQRVGEELEFRNPIIGGYLKTLSLELRAGRARKAAWRAFADRMGIDEASSLATMLRQAEEMGTSLGQTLRVFSADMRQRRILYAEEKAMALPAMLTLPLILFVFPVLLGVIMLPTAVMLGSALG